MVAAVAYGGYDMLAETEGEGEREKGLLRISQGRHRTFPDP